VLNMAEYKAGKCRSMIIAGCLGECYKQELLDEIPEVDADGTKSSDKLWYDKRISENLIEEITKAIKPFVFFSNQELYGLIAVEAISTYVFNLFEAIPYIHLTGSKGSGKTTLVRILSSLSHNPVSTVSVTPANLYRMIENEQPTLFIDEVEDLEKRGSSNDDVIQILNSGYQDKQRHKPMLLVYLLNQS